MRICPYEEAEREFNAARKRGIALVALPEPDYPARLAMIDDAPPLLAVRGALAALQMPMIAMVGSRTGRGLLFLLLTLLLWFMHRANIARLAVGTEGKIGGDKAPAA